MKLITVYSSPDAMQAHFLAGLLKSNGIPAIVTGENVALGGYLPGSIRVNVRVDDREAAAVMVERFISRTPAREASAPPWTCPHCGEQLEAQFTDCWNCQTARPQATGEAAADSSRKPADPFIPIDLPCIACEYNLRALPVDQLCPECGHPIYASLFRMLQEGLEGPEEYEIFQEVLQPCLDAVEQKLGFPIEAITFVMSAWPQATESVAGAGGSDDYDSILSALRAMAVDVIGERESGERALTRWKLDSTQNLSRLVGELRELRLLPDSV